MVEEEENFLSRWSRRKLEAKSGLGRKPSGPEPEGRPSGPEPEGLEVDAAQSAGCAAPAAPLGSAAVRTGETRAEREPKPSLTKDDFADVDFEALDHTSDYTRFMGADVPASIRSKALHKLWLSDPILSKAEELHDYAGDFTDAACAVGKVIATAYKVGRGFASDEEAAEGDRSERSPEAAAAPVITIAAEPADQPEVYTLVAQSDAYSAGLYPPESCHGIDVATLMQPNVRFFVARQEGTAVGCGSILLAADASAEIKRMFVVAEARRLGVGSRILNTLIDAARAEGITVIRLETGVKQPEAIGLYCAAGFEEIAPFGSYVADPLCLFMEKRLT